jgi:hypothetical protein
MSRTRTFPKELIGYQERGFTPFAEVLELVIPAGKKTVNFPSDQDFKSDMTKIIGMRVYVNNETGTAKSFISETKLLTQDMVASCGIELFENNTDRVYRFPLEKLIAAHNAFSAYANIFINGYSSKESKVILGKAAAEDMALLIELIYE